MSSDRRHVVEPTESRDCICLCRPGFLNSSRCFWPAAIFHSGSLPTAMRDLVAGRVDDARGAAFLTALSSEGRVGRGDRRRGPGLARTDGPPRSRFRAGPGHMRHRRRRQRHVQHQHRRGPCGMRRRCAGRQARQPGGIEPLGQRGCTSRAGGADRTRVRNGRRSVSIASASHSASRRTFTAAWLTSRTCAQKLGVRTIFNLLGPLANPAGAPYQLLGVGKPELLDPLAGALAELGTRHSVLVCSRDGLDEVSLAAPTHGAHRSGPRVRGPRVAARGVRPRPGLTRGDSSRRPRRERRDHPLGARGETSPPRGGSSSPTRPLRSGRRRLSSHCVRASNRPTRR